MKVLFAVLVFLVGAGTVAQTGMNAQLRASLGHGLFGALVNFAVGFVMLLGVLLLCRVPLPTGAAFSSVPLWAWFGGLIGAGFVATLASTGRELGAVTVTLLVVAGQLVASLVLDHFGWLGFPQRPLTVSKLVACLMLVGSLLLMRRP